MDEEGAFLFDEPLNNFTSSSFISIIEKSASIKTRRMNIKKIEKIFTSGVDWTNASIEERLL